MANDRTTDARDHDDSDLIENIQDAPSQQDGSGGTLARDVASQAEMHAVEDPANHERVTKSDDIENGQEIRPDRARGA